MPPYAPPLPNITRQPGLGIQAIARDLPAAARQSDCVAIVSGRDAVLPLEGMLQELAAQSQQPGAMHGLNYLIDHGYTARKTPHLVLLFAEEGDPQPYGAVLLFEYRVGPWGTGLYSTGDPFGVRTVIGPEHLRISFAVKACEAMLQHRPGMVLVSFKQEPTITATHLEPTRTACLWSAQTRLVQDHLPLAGTVDATLAGLGKRTRTHLRYYRRRLVEAVPCDFFPDVSSLIEPTDLALLEHLNRTSLEPLSQAIFNLQYTSAVLSPGGFVSGLRSKDGQWLALVGGWRQGGTTWVQWQTNTATFPSLSLGTALRLFLIEQEVARGTRTLAFHGGTSHSMSHAFPSERVVDLIARRGLISALLVRALPTILHFIPALSARGNFLADALRDSGHRWTKSSSLDSDEGRSEIG